MITSLVNINYKASVSPDQLKHLQFRRQPPIMAIVKIPKFRCTIIVFKSGKCRIMGLKQELTQDIIDKEFPLKIKLGPIQSCTFSIDFQEGSINLIRLNDSLKHDSIYEGELFPALRLVNMSPLCVNVFQSGKCVITGARSPTINMELIDRIYKLIYKSIS
jgi:TATA-box binding protein (TBP) (component of TFIID and TFIIIB)